MTLTTAARLPIRPAADRLPYLTVAALAAVLVVCLVVGAYAAVAGGAASRAGSGPGGLGGVPQLVLLAVAVLLGLPSAVAARARPVRFALVLAGPLTVAFGYFFFAHAVDPCALGVWGLSSTIGGAPVCETAAGSVSASERFHLLEHAVAGLLLVCAYAGALLHLDRRGSRRQRWTTQSDCGAG